jgi:hypothetical protein
MKPATELVISNNARVTIRMVSCGPCSKWRTISRSMANAPTKATATEIANATPYGRLAPTSSAQQMNVLNIANSPWAKLIKPIAR